MNCTEENRLLVHAYVDGELDAGRSVEMETHLENCPDCAAARDNALSLRSRFEAGGTYEPAPGDLAMRIRASLPRRAMPARTISRSRFSRAYRYASALGGAAVLVAIFFLVRPSGYDSGILNDVVSNHIRSLMADHLTDVASSDQHTVKPWFIGKLDFAPRVVDLATQGFPLIGGRLDYLGGNPVAALVYQYRKHVINLFIGKAKSAASTAPSITTSHGYAVAHWTNGGLEYWATTDAERSVIVAFQKALQGS